MGGEDKDRLDRLSSAPPETGDEGTPIPVRVETDPKAAAEESLRRADQETQQGRDVVREYQEKYYGADSETARLRQRAEQLASGVAAQFHQDWQPRSYSATALSEEERLWAALAHISALLTLGLAVVSGGWGALLLIFVPLAIYFSFRDRSDFVAFHALQAFAMQIIGTVGWLALLVVGTFVLGIGIAISALASVILVGIPFLILFVLLLIVFVLASLALPLGMVVFSILGAFNTYNGHDYRYPFIAKWIDQQLSGGFISTLL